MGNWNITIRGIGPHHNAGDSDADVQARALVAMLVKTGHQIHGASFTYGAAEDLVEGTEFTAGSIETDASAAPEIERE